MMELYTSLRHLKMVLNNGEIPPMTPLRATATRVLDPAFVLGAGGLQEDERKGLRCPVRGCGVYKHHLTTHLNREHKGLRTQDESPSDVVHRLMGIPLSVALCSTHVKSQLSSAGKKNQWMSRKALREGKPRDLNTNPEYINKRRSTRMNAATSANFRNLRGECERQLAHKILAMRDVVGSFPIRSAAKARYGMAFIRRVNEVYGSWENACACLGDRVRKDGLTDQDVYESMRAYFDIHKELPTSEAANAMARAPLIVRYQDTLNLLGFATWPEAMAHVAWYLKVDDPRYGRYAVTEHATGR